MALRLLALALCLAVTSAQDVPRKSTALGRRHSRCSFAQSSRHIKRKASFLALSFFFFLSFAFFGLFSGYFALFGPTVYFSTFIALLSFWFLWRCREITLREHRFMPKQLLVHRDNDARGLR
jgi:hypothetical protein